MIRSNGTSFANGGLDYGDALDWEIQRHLSKLNKKNLWTQSETSNDRSSKDGKSNSESTASDTESELDLWSEACTTELTRPAQNSLKSKVKILKGSFYIYISLKKVVTFIYY